MRLYEFSPPTMAATKTSQPTAMATETPGSDAQAGGLTGSSSMMDQNQPAKQVQNQLRAGKTINHPKLGPVRIKMDQGNKLVLDTAGKFGQDITVDKNQVMQMLLQQQQALQQAQQGK